MCGYNYSNAKDITACYNEGTVIGNGDYAALAPASLKSSYTATTTAAVSWNKVSGATEYKIYKYDSANKKWVLAKTITSADTTSATVTGLTSKTTTKLKVNAYLTKGTKTYYGKPGTMLSVTTK